MIHKPVSELMLYEDLKQMGWIECTLSDCLPGDEVVAVRNENMDFKTTVHGFICDTRYNRRQIDRYGYDPGLKAFRAPEPEEVRRRITLTDVIAHEPRAAIVQADDLFKTTVRVWWSRDSKRFLAATPDGVQSAGWALELPVIAWADEYGTCA